MLTLHLNIFAIVDSSKKKICVRHFILFYNLFLFVAGSVWVSTSLWFLFKKTTFIILTKVTVVEKVKNIDKGCKSFIEIAAFILAVTGLFIMLLSFVGCVEAYNPKRSVFITYIFLQTILALLGCSALFFCSYAYIKITGDITMFLLQTLQDFYHWNNATRETNVVSESWDAMQQELQCCGVENGGDYEQITSNKEDVQTDDYFSLKLLVPITCCSPRYNIEHIHCISTESKDYSNYYKGCKKPFVEAIKTRLYLLMGMAATAVLFAFIGLAATFTLWWLIRHQQQGQQFLESPSPKPVIPHSPIPSSPRERQIVIPKSPPPRSTSRTALANNITPHSSGTMKDSSVHGVRWQTNENIKKHNGKEDRIALLKQYSIAHDGSVVFTPSIASDRRLIAVEGVPKPTIPKKVDPGKPPTTALRTALKNSMKNSNSLGVKKTKAVRFSPSVVIINK